MPATLFPRLSITELSKWPASAGGGCTELLREGQFKSQPLLDEASILTCMAYVDRNSIRAGMKKETRNSDHTAIKQHIRELIAFKRGETPEKDSRSMEFAGAEGENAPDGLPFSLDDYFDLLDWSSGVVRDDKRSVINEALPLILEWLDIDADIWEKLLWERERLRLHHIAGRASAIKGNAANVGRVFLKGLSFGCELFPDPAPDKLPST